MRAATLGITAAVLLAACTVPPVSDRPASDGPERPPSADRHADAHPAPPSLGLFSRIKVPDGHEAVLRLTARGVQIFRCERIDDSFEWRFRQPEAELFDAQGRVVGRHGANFSFEHRDGSRLLGTVIAHDRVDAETLPWLLFSAKSFGKGELAGVSYVQRVNTSGGMPPSGCGAGQASRLLRVDFGADFVFYRSRG